ncbi:class I ribonucleotide reductase maintenance protein YfaE [Carnimonas bestiolae]|uniref:class I ribonucleotide reductase maintenance protein YfaE n=1 Tax=Carnimonas bestiolae TaxID=3402172 RepID=UPI003EDCAEBE
MAELIVSTGSARLAWQTRLASLLELLERHRLPVEFQCRSGYCGACRVRLLSGRVRYHQPPLACLNDGEILPCCCAPDSDIALAIGDSSEPHR